MSRDRLIGQLLAHEGLRLKPYTDTTGHVSIGVGRNLTDIGISHEEAMALLENDIDRTEAALLAALPWVTALDDVRRRVLVDMAFNLGVPGLLKFGPTLALIQAGRYAEAAARLPKTLWARQVGRRAVRLAAMLKSGKDA